MLVVKALCESVRSQCSPCIPLTKSGLGGPMSPSSPLKNSLCCPKAISVAPYSSTNLRFSAPPSTAAASTSSFIFSEMKPAISGSAFSCSSSACTASLESRSPASARMSSRSMFSFSYSFSFSLLNLLRKGASSSSASLAELPSASHDCASQLGAPSAFVVAGFFSVRFLIAAAAWPVTRLTHSGSWEVLTAGSLADRDHETGRLADLAPLSVAAQASGKGLALSSALSC